MPEEAARVASSLCSERGALLAGAEQGKAAGAIGVLQQTFLETGLPEERGLLVARDSGDWDGGAEEGSLGFRDDALRRYDLGQHGARNAENFQKFVVPIVCRQVHEHGARGVGDIGNVRLPACEIPDEPAIDGAEECVAGFRFLAYTAYVFQNPANFAGREIGVDNEASLGSDYRGLRGVGKMLTETLPFACTAS